MRRTTAVVAFLCALGACTSTDPTSTSESTTTSTMAAAPTTSLAEACRVTDQPDPDQIVVAYNRKDAEAMIRLVGQGPVEDPGLGLDETHFESVEGWLATADRQGDTITWVGYSPLPLQLYVERKNSFLADMGIEVLSTTLRFDASGACSVFIEATDFISQPDPCAFSDRMPVAVPEGCTGPFEPRHSHSAVWAGSEVLIFGGESGTSEAGPLRTGLALDPVDGSIRDLPDAPLKLEWWPRSQAFWTGSEMGVVGRIAESDPIQVVVMLLDPTSGVWRVSEPRPTDQWAVGAAVWTGDELLLVGGDTSDARNSAWSYDPAADTWVDLGEAPFHAVEGNRRGLDRRGSLLHRWLPRRCRRRV